MLRRAKIRAFHLSQQLVVFSQNAARIYLRHVKLQLLPQLTKWKRDNETSKVVLYKHRGFATLHTILHLVPLSACIILLTLNFRTYFVGNIASSAASAFQFPAKLLELIIQASLATILLSIIRTEIAVQNLPFGALFAPLRTADVSYLWSLEYWGLTTSMWTQSWRKASLVVTILLFVALSAVVGPSSAVLMVPRTTRHLTDQYLVVLNENHTLFPSRIQSLNTTGLKYTGPNAILRMPSGGSFAVSDDVNTRQMSVYFNQGAESSALALTFSTSTLPGRQSCYGVSLPTIYQRGSFPGSTWDLIETETYQPVVYASCRRWLTYDMNSNDSLVFSPDDPRMNNLIRVRDLFSNVSNNAAAVFLDQPSANSKRHSVLLATGEVIPNPADADYYSVLACTIDAMWAKTKLNQTATIEIFFTLSNNPTDPIPASQMISIPAAIANEQIASLIKDMGLVLTPDRAIALALAGGLPVNLAKNQEFPGPWVDVSLADYTYQLGSNLTDNQTWSMQHYIDDHELHRKYKKIFVATTTDWTDPATLTFQASQYYSEGYGYSLQGATDILSAAVLAMYCVIVTVYLICSLITGRTATSWDSTSELVMLGLNSQNPSHIGRTSAGVETLSTFQRLVSVKVNDQDSLELVFDDDPSVATRSLKQIELNHAY